MGASKRDLLEAQAENPLFWIIENKILTENGEPLEFRDHALMLARLLQKFSQTHANAPRAQAGGRIDVRMSQGVDQLSWSS